jgi:hypothetical protein
MRWRRRALPDLRAGTRRVGHNKSSCSARQRVKSTSLYTMELGYHITLVHAGSGGCQPPLPAAISSLWGPKFVALQRNYA